MKGRDWLRSFGVMRQSDTMICHVWADGGSACTLGEEQIRVRGFRGSSHLSAADYRDAALEHLAEFHPQQSTEMKSWKRSDKDAEQ